LKKKQQLRIKGHIGSFIYNNHGTGKEADRILREMKFAMSFPLLVVEPDYLLDSEVLAFSRVYTP
jgi:hypothetical protein